MFLANDVEQLVERDPAAVHAKLRQLASVIKALIARQTDTAEFPVVVSDQWVEVDSMVFIGPQRERSFRCECNCNVFRRHAIDVMRYKCNACGATYTGDVDVPG